MLHVNINDLEHLVVINGHLSFFIDFINSFNGYDLLRKCAYKKFTNQKCDKKWGKFGILKQKYFRAMRFGVLEFLYIANKNHALLPLFHNHSRFGNHIQDVFLSTFL